MTPFARGPVGGGTWWPALPGETCSFHWHCPSCGIQNDATLARIVEDDGRCERSGPLTCRPCGWFDTATLLGWKPEHAVVLPPHPDASKRRAMRHFCGNVLTLDEDTALRLAHDPHMVRGHWCERCGRHGWNHEWRWVANNHVVGGGWLGRRRYEEIAEQDPDFLRELSRFCQVPVRWGAQ